MAAPVVTVNAVDVTAKIESKTLKLSRNTLDFTLVDPASIPAMGQTVTSTNPTWAGTVTQTIVTDNMKVGHVWVDVTATNDDELVATAAPFGLSDTDYWDLEIETTLHDGDTEVRGSLKTLLPGLEPGHEFELTSTTHGYSAEQFGIKEVSVDWFTSTKPVFDITFGDFIVELSTWAQDESAGILPITTTKITDEAVTTPKIAANSITAAQLEAELVLSSLIKTNAMGKRIELDPQGLRAYDEADNLLVNVPTDDSPVSVTGELEATSFTSISTAELRGNTTIPQEAVVTLESGIVAPPNEPSVFKTLIISATLEAHDFPRVRGYGGGYYDTAGGADGATACYVGLTYDDETDTPYVVEWDVSTGLIDRATALPNDKGIFSHSSKGGFITRIGTNWFVTGLQTDGSDILWKFLRSDGSYVAGVNITPDFGATSQSGWPIKTNGTNVYVLGRSSSANNFRVVAYNTSLVEGTTVEISDPTPTTGYDFLYGGNAMTFEVADIGSGTRWWIGYSEYNFANGQFGTKTIYEVNTSTGALIANTSFENHGSLNVGLFWDGTRFNAVSSAAIRNYSTWTWTTETPIYQVAYSWYDSAGTTHETSVSPRKAFTHSRRWYMSITTPALPGAGGADEPNNRRIYLLRSATDTGEGTLKLQATSTDATTTLSTYDSGGAADGGGTPFAVSTPAVLEAHGASGDDVEIYGDGLVIMSHMESPSGDYWIQSTGIFMQGDGYFEGDLGVEGAFKAFGGPTFPVSPATGWQYYRSDHNRWYVYDGTRWISTGQFNIGPFLLVTAVPYSATANQAQRIPVPSTNGGSDIYIEDIKATFHVASGGTALGASHKWVATLEKWDSSGATTIDSNVCAIASGSSNVWRSTSSDIDVAVGNFAGLFVSWTKTGTPGNLTVYMTLNYRIVAT